MADKEQHPVEIFVEHQGNALKEVGRAAASMIPAGIRSHGWNAIEESAKGLSTLVTFAAEELSKVGKLVKEEIILSDTAPRTSVQVDLEDDSHS